MKKISKELKSPKCCGSTGEKDQLIELAEEWEEKVEYLNNQIEDLNQFNDELIDANNFHESEKEALAKKAFFAGLNAFNNKRTSTTKSWLNYKVEANL